MRTQIVPGKTKHKVAIHWAQRSLIPLPVAAEVLGCSVGQIYKLGHCGEVDLVNLGGRTLARTRSITRIAEQAPPWVPAQHRIAKALASRSDQRRQVEGHAVAHAASWRGGPFRQNLPVRR